MAAPLKTWTVRYVEAGHVRVEQLRTDQIQAKFARVGPAGFEVLLLSSDGLFMRESWVAFRPGIPAQGPMLWTVRYSIRGQATQSLVDADQLQALVKDAKVDNNHIEALVPAYDTVNVGEKWVGLHDLFVV